MRRICKPKQAAGLLLMFLMVIMAGCSDKRQEDMLIETELTAVKESDTDAEKAEDASPQAGVNGKEGSKEHKTGEEEIFVYVCGQVANPGVYPLPLGSRLYEALNAAGGLLPAAAGEALNQAEKVEDGQKVYVPSKDETAALADSQAGPDDMAGADDGRVDLNTADKARLMTLTGIGERKAEAILRYREKHGNFQSAEDIMQVEGIKEGTYEKIKEQIKAG